MTKDKDKRQAEWLRHRAKSRPYVMRACLRCRGEFNPRGPQVYCGQMRSSCETCSAPILCGRRRFCSRRCVSAIPDNVARLHTVRGRKPRSSAKRQRPWRGCAEDREWRTRVFVRDGYRCVLCGSGGRLQADHIEPVSTRPDLRHELSNGRTLCVPCHKQTPTYGWRGYWLKVRAGESAAKRLAQGALPLEFSA